MSQNPASPPPPPPPPGQTPPPVAGEPTQDERNLALAAHLGTFAGYLFPFANLIVPIVIYAMKKDESAYVRTHAAESINFQIIITIASIVASVLMFVLIGCFILPVILILDIVFVIMASMAASRGELYKYPMTPAMVT